MVADLTGSGAVADTGLGLRLGLGLRVELVGRPESGSIKPESVGAVVGAAEAGIRGSRSLKRAL